MSKEYVAHLIRDVDGKIVGKQTVQQHSLETAKLAEKFAIEPLKNLAYNTALYHDIGKYQASFQKKILEDDRIKVAHAMAGAKVVRADFGDVNLAQLMEYVISGHHAGIPDVGSRNMDSDEATLYGYLQRSTEDFSVYKEELVPRNIDWQDFLDFMLLKANNHQEGGEVFAFLTRYIFSCVTDADSLDTHYFCTKEKTEPLISNFPNCLKKLDAHTEKFQTETALQKARGRLQQQVYAKIKSDAEIFLMNMPTGSGKTICSLKFALERAIEFSKKKIIYVIPYNSIIDQTAEIIEKIFGDDVQLLRHQSTFVYDKTSEAKETDDKNDDVDYAKNAQKACENWDGDFIITTAVQFFESIHGNRRNKLRKLHNMADSIIIFDEAHLMPEKFLIPCLRSITNIVQCLNSEAVFLTATMPNYEDLLDNYCNVKILNLIEDTSDFKAFEKAEISYKIFADKEQLLADLLDANSKLIVCNSRKTAKEIYELATGEKYHLSTYMTALDRQSTIAKIKEQLKKLDAEFSNGKVPEHRKITVVSTSLIEAGVDLDFQWVYRELAGLDNILQAGGRCNREGRRQNGKIMVTGDYASFNRPEFKVERVSYDVPTPGALEGMLKAVYWKPALRYVIDKIVIFNPINFANIRKNEVKEKVSYVQAKSNMKGGNNDLTIYTKECISQRASMVLKDVCYGVEFHFEMTGLKSDHLDESPEKHYNIIKRRLEKGQSFKTPCLGNSECPVKSIVLVDDFDMTQISPEIIAKGDVDLGFMSHHMAFVDGGKPLNDNWENPVFSDKATTVYYRPHMINGVINVANYSKNLLR